MGELEEAYASWRDHQFPPGSTRDSLDELHADLALADTWVAEAVVPFVKEGQHEPARVDVIKELGKLRFRAAELARTSDGDDRRLADSYSDYADLLLRVYRGFLAQARPD